MRSANSVVIVGHLVGHPQTDEHGARAAIGTHDTDHQGNVYFTQNFIKAIDQKNIEILKDLKPGTCIALTGKLQTNNKVTSVVIKTIEECKGK